MLTAVMLDDKGLRVGNLDKVVWVLLRRDSLMRVSIANETRMAVTYAKQRAHVS